ncbi:MAG TPA: PQQ-binding-like beta-propeller repeat protein [Vicinamibacterales bacterium]|nr:PQQ-binding-like beta-propeller repeat protein [Vicinamibacterales bacterium]
MHPAFLQSFLGRTGVVAMLVGLSLTVTSASDWPEWRGPARDGSSPETNLPSRWSPQGENLAWRIPIGSRSAPVAFGNRLYINSPTPGDPTKTQERLIAIDAETGKVVWERRFSLFLSDVPQHRASWASPAVDPETGNVYLFTVAAQLVCVSPEGKVLWDRSLTDEYGAVTTHGGRTTSPIIEGDKVILNTLILAWGDLNRPGNRYFAFDKKTGQTIWISSPQSRHYDTNYSTPIVATIDGTRAMIVGGTDGVYHALKVNTGEKIWSVEVSKRAILNSALFRDNIAYITHGEENIDTTEMGMVGAIDAARSGVLAADAFKWRTRGFLPTFASPVMDNERLYVMDNSAIVGAFDLKTGAKLWERVLGTLQKGSPVLADGKLYVGTENGKFYILRPSATGVEVLDEDVLGSAQSPEPIVASPIVADGRIYVTSMDAMYAIGKRNRQGAQGAQSARGAQGATGAQGAPAVVQVFPYEVLLTPGQTATLKARLFDAKGNFIREEPAAQWAVDQATGTVDTNGVYTAAKTGSTAGFIKATVGGLTGQARVRVIEAPPWTFDFEKPASDQPPAWWVGGPTKVFQRTVEGVGNVLLRPRDETVGRRAKVFFGQPNLSGLTVEADVRGREQRRQRGDVGLINERYGLVLFGNGQKLELHPWQAADEMTTRIDFKWDPDKWYRMKLRVDHEKGVARVRGKVWPADAPEPAAWTIEKVDTIPHVMGSPGIYADGISDVYFDNVKVYRNQ